MNLNRIDTFNLVIFEDFYIHAFFPSCELLLIIWNLIYFWKLVVYFRNFQVHYYEIVYVICSNFCRVSAVHYFPIFCMNTCICLSCFLSCKTCVLFYISVMTLGFFWYSLQFVQTVLHVYYDVIFTPRVLFIFVNYRWTMP